MITLIIFFILFLFIIYFYGMKKGFDNILNIWLLVIYIIMICIHCKLSIYIIIILCVFIKYIRIPICFFLFILFTISGGHYKTLRIFSLIMFNIELNTQINITNIPRKPTIFLSNYPSNYIEYFIPMLLGDKVCLLVHAPAIKFVKHFYGLDHVIPVYKGDFNNLQQKIKEKIDEGYHIFSYIERDYFNRKNIYDITDLRSGMFSIAKNINTTITPIVCDHIEHTVGILNTKFKIIIGKTKYISNISEEMIYISNFFKYNLRKMSIK